MRVSVFGLGYVGCVTAACLASEGHEVLGVEPMRSKADLIRAGRSPIVEPGLDDLLLAAREAGTLDATDDAAAAIAWSSLSIVCVGTPSRANGSLDLSHVLAVAAQIGAALRDKDDFHVVALRSTMLPGSVLDVVVPALEQASGKTAGTGFGVAFCPEFLRETTAIRDFYEPPYSVVGVVDPRTEAALRELLGFLAAPLHVVDVPTAEALKYACNAFHAVKVTFANEMARVFHSSGVDTRQVMDLFVQDTDLNISPRYLRPGFAFGGSCLPKDVRALTHHARSQDQDLPLLSSLLPSNATQVEQALLRVLATGARRVALLGLSFKPGTDDLRESPFVTLSELLIGKGVELTIYDPVVQPELLVGTNKTYVAERLPHLHRILRSSGPAALEGAELVVLGTHDATAVDAARASGLPVLDLTGRFSARDAVASGWEGLAW